MCTSTALLTGVYGKRSYLGNEKVGQEGQLSFYSGKDSIPIVFLAESTDGTCAYDA